MGKILFMSGVKWTLEDALSLDVQQLKADELEETLEKIEVLYDELEEEEPEDIESDEYYAWAETMEALDDLMDEIQDLLEE